MRSSTRTILNECLLLLVPLFLFKSVKVILKDLHLIKVCMYLMTVCNFLNKFNVNFKILFSTKFPLYAIFFFSYFCLRKKLCFDLKSNKQTKLGSAPEHFSRCTNNTFKNNQVVKLTWKE